MAFEFNGIFHHSESFKPSGYHRLKTQLCAEQGIRLIHVFEDDWNLRKDIVKARITDIIGSVSEINATDCIVREIKPRETYRFLNENHLKGACRGEYKYGLFCNGNLIAAMIFGNQTAGNLELLRYCTKLNTSVIDGVKMLFKYHLDKYNKDVVAYDDISWSEAELYESLGFKYESTSDPDYAYIFRSVRKSRLRYTKEKLIAKGFTGDSEHDIMLGRNIYRIYDCGKSKYVHSMK